MVIDPHLDKHLAHWGINMMQVGGAMHAGGRGLVTSWHGNSAQPGLATFQAHAWSPPCSGAPLLPPAYPLPPTHTRPPHPPTVHAQMEKTEKTMAELELALSQSYEFSRLTEGGGAGLRPLHGPGHTGLINLGNSCYMASVLQVRGPGKTWGWEAVE